MIILSDLQKNKDFEVYFDTLIEWNKKFNLTSITERDDVYLKHFLDSVLPADLFKKNKTVLDIGAGAGFPSLPLKLVRSDLSVTMIDSVNKKIGFLQHMIKVLNISDIKALHTRAEDFKMLDFYDYAISRAVAPLTTLLEYSMPFLKIGGLFIAYKTEKAVTELAEAGIAIKILGGEINDIINIPLNADTMRCFVLIKKISNTPSIYPRGKNKPRTQPLGLLAGM